MWQPHLIYIINNACRIYYLNTPYAILLYKLCSNAKKFGIC